MLNNNTNFPILATKRIVISRGHEFTPESTTTSLVDRSSRFGNRRRRTETTTTPASSREFSKIKVEFLIKSQERNSLSRWLQSSFQEYAQYLRIYFIALDDSSADLANFLYDPSTRYQALQALTNLQTLTGRRANRDTKSIAFSEVLQNNSFTTTPATDLSGDYYHDIYSELEIELSEVNLEATDKLHLIGFIHMDADAYLSDMGISRDPDSPHAIESKGTELVYDLLLQRGETGLEVQTFREVFYVNQQTDEGVSLEPYYGPAHYHGEENPGPDGYIGWMAGSPGEDMGPRLESRTIRNYKVFSSLHSSTDSSYLSFDARTGFPVNSSGELVDSYVSSIADREDLLDSSMRLREAIRASSFTECLKANNFVKSSDIGTAFVRSISEEDPVTGQITNEKSHHALTVGIDYFNLVRSRSAYGDVLNFHKNKGNNSLVELFLAKSEIINLEITRERVTNSAYNYNLNCTPEFVTYDVNEPSKKLVNAGDDFSETTSYKKKLIESSSPLASVSEIEVVTNRRIRDRLGRVQMRLFPIPGYNRFFSIKDYDLFHNVQTGKYRHSLQFTIKDGVSQVISDSITQLDESIKEMRAYLLDAEQPVIKSSLGTYVEGSYDYSVNDFHESFRQKDYSSTIQTAVEAYRKSTLIISGKGHTGSQLQQIRTSLDNSSTSLATLGDFVSLLQSIRSIMEKILLESGDLGHVDGIKKQGQTFVPSAGSARKLRTIEIKINAPEVIDAISEGTIMANFSPFQETSDQSVDITPNTPNLSMENFVDRVVATPMATSDETMVPAAYSVFASSPFVVKDFEVVPGALEPPQMAVNPVSTLSFQKSAPKVVSTVSSFNNLGRNSRNSETLKINIMRSKNSVTSGFINKPISAMAFGSFANVGVMIKPVFGQSVSSVDKGVQLNTASRTKQVLKDMFVAAETNNVFKLTPEVKATLEAAAFTGITREEVMKIAEDNFSDLNQIASTLGPIFDSMVPLIGSVQAVATNFPTVTMQTEEDKFTGDSLESDRGTIREFTPYKEEEAVFMLATPGSDSEKITLSEMKELSSQKSETERFVMLKIHQTKKEDAIVSVNDGFLLRV